ncbi:hypothetical protein [Deinococcus sp.]|uniref:hypothetical protein n=1 Tax=Deinococcus sp. TaxID=47478 RepID=UPI0025D2DDDD|nr:hypothetical protein [Deinococcus sp.]
MEECGATQNDGTPCQDDGGISRAGRVGLSVAGAHERTRRLWLGLGLMCFLKMIFGSNVQPENLTNPRYCLRALPEIPKCSTVASSGASIKVAATDHVVVRAEPRPVEEARLMPDL